MTYVYSKSDKPVHGNPVVVNDEHDADAEEDHGYAAYKNHDPPIVIEHRHDAHAHNDCVRVNNVQAPTS